MAVTSSQPEGSAPPNPTVYIRNLEEGIKLPALTTALHEIFSEYGTILDIVAKSNLRAKGQAFVVFDNAESAANAIDEVNGFELFDKPMVCDFARSRSDATVKKTAGEESEEFEAHKRHRLAEKERKQALAASQQSKLKRPADATMTNTTEANKPAKAARGTGLKSSNPSSTAIVPDEYLPPNKILFVQNLPEGYNDIDALGAIFGRFEGFREVRLVPGRKGIAFVEYESEVGAIGAKEGTAGMVLGDGAGGKGIKVTYQRQ
ncbi:MAG: hypothetical protein M1819_001171 [Sarea resinae]|nr:MAG: hypothetical protein M1819_001171 [Sarea resinae]